MTVTTVDIVSFHTRYLALLEKRWQIQAISEGDNKAVNGPGVAGRTDWDTCAIVCTLNFCHTVAVFVWTFNKNNWTFLWTLDCCSNRHSIEYIYYYPTLLLYLHWAKVLEKKSVCPLLFSYRAPQSWVVQDDWLWMSRDKTIDDCIRFVGFDCFDGTQKSHSFILPHTRFSSFVCQFWSASLLSWRLKCCSQNR